ncbi:hypothetical protein HDU87_005281 [Geranomyces variabilis]|uniref:Uncharacterized protein n=1 Tax=Geranomyces variabilis TaxID=109894 RepID=A0AAD5XLX4_9FUNG|nr:hypothetical protein HDU87_005281 [Geranomyces variabilis]
MAGLDPGRGSRQSSLGYSIPTITRTWSDSSSADTPPGTATPAESVPAAKPVSMRSSLFRRSSSSESLTTEETILSNVFAGYIAPTIAEALLENDGLEVVPVYDAIAIWDYDPESDEDAVRFKAGDRLKVFGKQDVRSTVLGAGDWQDGTDWNWQQEVEVQEGWCQVEARGVVGFAPVAYMRFASDNTPMETRSEVELAIAERPTLASFDPLPATITQSHLADSFLGSGSAAEMSITTSAADSSESRLNYPSAMTALGNGVGAITGRVRKSLKRLLGSWFDADSVQEFIVGSERGGSFPSSPMLVDADFDFSVELDRGAISPTGDTHLIQRDYTWASSAPKFNVTIQSAERRRKVSLPPSSSRATVTDDYIVYKCITWFQDDDPGTFTALTVYRRYADFDWLASHLQSRFPPDVVPLPTLPPKHILSARRFDSEYVEARRRRLERYLNAIARHPVLKAEEALVLFLSCGGQSERGLSEDDADDARQPAEYDAMQVDIVEDDQEWLVGKRDHDAAMTRTLRGGTAGPASFFKRIVLAKDLHPENEYPNMMDRFATHLSLVESHLDPLVESANKHQQCTANLNTRYRDLAACLEILGRGRPEAGRHLRNLASCWKRGCFECHEFSNALLAVSKHLNGVADTYANHAKDDLIVFAESVREYQTAVASFQALSQLHDLAESRADELKRRTVDTNSQQRPPIPAQIQHQKKTPSSSEPLPHRDNYPSHHSTPTTTTAAGAAGMKRRLETILAVSQAEVERLHGEKTQQWDAWVRGWVDSQIVVQEKVLNHLYAARDALAQK